MSPRAQPQGALGRAIRELRIARAISQEDLAHAAGVTTGTLSAIERGKSNPTWGTVRAIAESLDVSMQNLAGVVDRHEL